MNVHTIKVSYVRAKKPADYEKAEPSVELSATFEDGEYNVSQGLSLMHDACKVVYAGLGYDIPEGVAAKLKQNVAPEAGKIESNPLAAEVVTLANKAHPTQPGPLVTAAAPQAITPVTEGTTEGAPRGRGRPPGSKGKPKADTAGGVVAVTNGSDIPTNAAFDGVQEDGSVIPDGKPVAKLGDNISRNPEDRQDPTEIPAKQSAAVSEPKAVVAEANGADIPVVAPAVVAAVSAEPTPADLQLFIQTIMKEHPKLVTIEKVKGIISQHGVARVSDLVKDGVSQVGSVKKMIEALVPAKAAA